MHADHQQESGILCRNERHYETISRCRSRMSAGRSSGFHQRRFRLQCAVHFRAGSAQRRLLHSSKNLAHGRPVTLTKQLYIGLRHTQRGNTPSSSESSKFTTLSTAVREIEPKLTRRRQHISGGEVQSQKSKIGIAGKSNGRCEVHVTMSSRTPASGFRTATGVRGIVKLMLFPVGESCKGLRKRSQRNGNCRMLPTGSEQLSGVGVEQ